MILALGAAGRQRRQAARIFQSWHLGTRPSPMTIVNTYETLKQTGSFTRKRKKASAISDEARSDVLSFMAANPHASVRNVSTETGVPKSTAWRILKTAGLHPYHLQLHQCLEPRDLQNRLSFANWILIQQEQDDDFLSKVLWSDEASFSRNCQVNVHNAHYWSERNPCWLRRSRHQYQWSFNVWCGIYGSTIVGPLFFDNTLTGKRYVSEILKGPVEDFCNDVPLAQLGPMWFQHDGAPAHSCEQARAWLDSTFPGQWIGRNGPVLWPARSPDLNPLDFFLWGYIKDLVYTAETTTPQALQETITEACRNIPATVLKAVTGSLLRRCQYCIAAEGDLFEHVL